MPIDWNRYTTDEHGIIMPRSAFWAIESSAKPIYCAGCGDVEVITKGQVCGSCRNSDPSDWVRMDDYNAMRELARMSDEIGGAQ